MARKKKTKAKAEKEKPSRQMVTEFGGWKSGDRCYTVFNGESKPSLCDIIEFHPGDSTMPCASVIELSTSKYRVTAIESIADTAKEAKALSQKRKDLSGSQKKKK